MTNLSPNFTLEEFTRNGHGIDNVPNAMQIKNMEFLCDNVLEPLREHYGHPVVITSGYRCPELNKAVGGADNSQHTKGEAADLHILGVRNDDVWNFIKEHLAFDQLIAERLRQQDGAAGWIHCSYSISHNRRDAISSPARGEYVKGLVYA